MAGRAVCNRLAAAQEARLSLNTVHAERYVKQRADNGRQPNDADPANGRPRIAFGKNDVARGANNDYTVGHDENPRPDRRKKPGNEFRHDLIVVAALAACQWRPITAEAALGRA